MDEPLVLAGGVDLTPSTVPPGWMQPLPPRDSGAGRSRNPRLTTLPEEKTMSEPETQIRVQQVIGDCTPTLVSLTDEVLFGDIWARTGLSPVKPTSRFRDRA